MNMYSLRPLLYVLLAAVDPVRTTPSIFLLRAPHRPRQSLLRAVRALRPTAPSESVRTAHLQPWDVSVSTLANTVSTAPHTMPVLPRDPAWADAASAASVDEEKQTDTEDEDEVQAASIARQI
ncbi:hypothetical protein GGX14DRAFT_406616 [Mycena pura]|uniref:Secreted protein n=1 Tax=Mycena pura TaxID=153505 RepID=A0AAD6XZH9_9AGAR|nr:hypothetical protein GGX14DRAFT_406616 [Mycena pura]